MISSNETQTEPASSALNAKRIGIARNVFAGWSSGDPDAPEPYWSPDGVLDDVASGRFEGWANIRAFFASGLSRTGNLVLIPDEFWFNESSLVVRYVMSGDVVLPETFGPEYVGKRWSVPALSTMQFDEDRVVLETDYHDKGSRARSLGIGL